MESNGITMRQSIRLQAIIWFALLLLLCLPLRNANAQDLDAILEDGVLRHLGIPYANFVTGGGDGLDVELIQRFADHLGVRYEFIETDWPRLIGDLTGHNARGAGQDAELLEATPVRGDVAATGITIRRHR